MKIKRKQHRSPRGSLKGLVWIKFRLSPSLVTEIDMAAHAEQLSRSQMIGKIVREWCAERKRLAAERQLGELTA